MAQQGMPPSPVPALNILRAILEEYDPRIIESIMGQRDPVSMLRRLVAQHGMTQEFASPELLQLMAMQDQVAASGMLPQLIAQFAAAGGDAAANVLPFAPPPAGAGSPPPAQPQLQQGRAQQDGAAFGTQRAQSEAMRI